MREALGRVNKGVLYRFLFRGALCLVDGLVVTMLFYFAFQSLQEKIGAGESPGL